ncbi:BQ5605_C016g08109 [Microbotryum silenes-dioicae]|uniref:Nitrate reductase [NADPH] n=1 Tax=Microbotryum silenes-dioicae TaxID=796604 RepID=A0A2X0MQ54_9BASI|nr:BQ5605_C016g08109 [Microbotryum silenes-dioicae]
MSSASLSSLTSSDSEDLQSQGSAASTAPTSLAATPAPSSPKQSSNALSFTECRTSAPKEPDHFNSLPSPFYPASLLSAEEKQEHLLPALPLEYPALPATTRPEQPCDADRGTPDEWIVRDEKLVRLTGKWPFNCEPPLPDLWKSGFLTPTRLFYVRNHGVVPKVSRQDAEAWTFDIGGLVKRPCTLSLADLLDPSRFNAVTLPVTLVCAGNRRKEQNVVRKSLGFSWGAAGLSTALFTGVYLADVLDYVCPQNEGKIGQPGFKRAEHVIFEGAEDLPNGKYGTSQRLRWARLREKGMMLAWAMNGEALEPDHGYPLRLVVPGQIGGRSVKWLKKIIVSDKESDHHLHYWDNKVLPTTLMPEQARSERQWWYDPRYIINDLNTNSAVACPAHDEQLVVPVPTEANPSPTYTVQGYAYAGGGRRVTRMEITLDDGDTWSLCDIRYPEDDYRQMPFSAPVWGTLDITDRDECFCWAFWKIEIPIEKLKDATSIAIRGMDEGLNLQGKTMYWNPTGMMNNCWFRVVIHSSMSETGETVLRFEHPTMPGSQPGGWMERMKDNGEDILRPQFGVVPTGEESEILLQSKESAKLKKSTVVMTKEGVTRKITMTEVQAHNKESEPWFVVKGEVYDGTGFLAKHPGGAESITLVAGEDATEDFTAIHSIDAKAQLADYHIGTLVVEEAPSAVVPSTPTLPDPIFLNKSKWKAATLISIEKLNHDSRNYRFALEYPEQQLGLPTGQHVYARLRRKVSPGDAEDKGGVPIVEGELVQRAYTPVSSNTAQGFLDLLIKVYFRTPDFPEGGRMTLGFDELQIGDKVEFKGPLGSFRWLGKGMCNWKGVKRRARNIGMICGGSGITPIIQVMRGIIHDSEDIDTNVWVLNANKTEADILLRAELEELGKLVGPSRCRQHLVLSKGPADWAHSKGRINKQMLIDHLPPPGPDSLVLICGPDPMINEIIKPGLAELGWDVPNTLVIF